MHRQHLFDVQDLPTLHGLIRDNALGTLILPVEGHLQVDHLPFVLETSPMSRFGTLHTHAAQDNRMWAHVRDDCDCMVVFGGPNAYISPSWYPSRAKHGRVQPSWYYSVVHAYGRMKLVHDRDGLARGIRAMTDHFEGDRPNAWRVDEAPSNFIDALVPHIVGINIEIIDLVGKSQVGQQRNSADRAGIVSALRQPAQPAEHKLADMIAAAAPKR
jgi:transcriptional regulator